MRRSPVAVLGVVLALLTPAFASAADRYVRTTGSDSANNCLSVESPCRTIGRAVGESASGDVINIGAGTYSGTGNVGIEINQAKDLSFKGAGKKATIISGGGTNRLFLFQTYAPATITANFSDLSLRYGHGDGGAIKATQEVAFTLNLSRVSVSGNSAPGDAGGAIQARNGNVAICESAFTNNSAFIHGAIWAVEVAIANCPSGSATPPATTFTDNESNGGYPGGGAIGADKVTADNAIFDGNTAPDGDGGAILISPFSTDATVLNLSNVTFSNNSAGSGGAFRVNGTGNVLVSDATFENNDALYYGGAFRTDGGDVRIDRSTITGSDAGAAGAASVDGPGTLTVEASTISDNTATWMPAVFKAGREISIANSTLQGNAASSFMLYSDTAIRLRSVTSSGNGVASGHFYAPDLEIANSVINESGTLICDGSDSLVGGGNVLSDTVGHECDGVAPTRVSAASMKLGALADNGGPTKTISIGHGSSALGIAGSPNACPDMDQRGELRDATGCDAGAFERPSFMLTVTRSGAGSGTVTGAPTDTTPGAIDCGSACYQEFDDGTPVALTAVAAAGSRFTGWTGACSNASATCTVTMSEARSVAATFGVAPPAPTPALGPAPGPAPQAEPAQAASNSTAVTPPAPLGGAFAMRGPVGRTTGTLPPGANRVSQTARPSGGSATEGFVQMTAPRATKGTCRIAKRKYTCTIRLAKGAWAVTTTAQGPKGVVAQDTRRVTVR